MLKVTDRHTAVDYAHVLKDLADTDFAHAKTIVLVQDNLSIHSKASLYEAFPAVEARRLVERFNGTTLQNMAVGSIWPVSNSASCDVPVPRYRPHPRQTNPHRRNRRRQHDRNVNHTKADWQFTTNNARIKLKHLYPAI